MMDRQVVAEVIRLLEAGERFALATLADTRGSTPQKAGARLVVRSDGSTLGTLGGGCIEAEAWEAARRALETGTPAVLDFTLNEEIAVDYGLACGGTERILIDPRLSERDLPALRQVQEAVSGSRRCALVAVVGSDTSEPGRTLIVDGDGATTGDVGPLQAAARSAAVEALRDDRPLPSVRRHEGAEFFVEVYAAADEVVIVGAGHVGKAVASLAKFAGYRVAVIDDRPDFANSERFPDADSVLVDDIEQAVLAYPATRNSAIVIVTRGHKYDYQALSAAARSEAGYVGLMGSRRKVALIYRQLLDDGIPRERLQDIHAPIGLDIGAVSPEEIALSIVSEITAARNRRNGGPMTAGTSLLERVDKTTA